MSYPTEDRRLWLILPFAYKTPFYQACSKLASSGWKEDDFSSKQIFFHIKSLLSKENRNERIGARFVLNDRVGYNLQHNTTAEYQIWCAKDNSFCNSFFLKNIELILFETQVAFLVFEVNLRETISVEEMTLVAYYLKKFNKDEITVLYRKKHSQDVVETIETNLDEITTRLLATLEVETYFETEKKPPRQAFIFSAATLSAACFAEMRQKNDLGRVIFELRRSFKKSYKPALREFDLENNPDVLQLFENIYWGFSLEGVTCLAFYTNDKETDEFVKSFMGRLSQTYLYLLLLALHQRYTLLKYNIDAAKLQKTPHGDLPEDLSAISHLQAQIAWFQLRAMFDHISSNTHYTLLYERFCQVFRIKALASELMDEIRTLAILSRLKQDEREREREKEKRERRESLERIFIALSTLLVGVSLASDGLQSGMTEILDLAFGAGFAELYKTGISWAIFLFVLLAFGFFWYSSSKKASKPND